MSKERSSGKKKQTLFPSDEIATEISSCISRDLSRVPLFDRTRDSDVLGWLRSQQIDGTLKRYQRFADYDRDALERQAFDRFISVNDHMRTINGFLLDKFYLSSPVSKNHDLSFIIKGAQLLIKQVLGPFWWDELHTMCKHGPGSTIGVSFEDTSVDKKFAYPMSHTKGIDRLFDVHTRSNTLLERAIQDLNSRTISPRYELVESSRGTTVDKTSDKRRMIAVEPTLNMYFQQGLMLMMYARLKSVGLDIESLPQRHRDLARVASINRSYGTIDFASASDTVSYELVRRLLPSDWFYALNMVRTPSMELGGVPTLLNMFSTMGNATTFPLETLIFWALACMSHHITVGDPGCLVTPKTKRACSVFGDDCILPTASCPLFIRVCGMVGFLVNEEKSFIDPELSFRESCGGDYYQGFDVRPYKLKAPNSQRLSDLEPWLYTILNNILPIYTTYFGYCESVLTMELGSYFQKLFSQYKFKMKLVPADFPDDAGLRCSLVSHDIRPRLLHTVDLLTTLGFNLSPIYRSDFDTIDFAYVKFQYRKARKRNEFIRYALELTKFRGVDEDERWASNTDTSRVSYHKRILLLWLRQEMGCGFSNTEVFALHKAPIRKKGGYVVSRTQSKFY